MFTKCTSSSVLMLFVFASTVLAPSVTGAYAEPPGPAKDQPPAKRKYSLLVEPDDPYERTGARYTMSSEGKQVWSCKRPYTLKNHIISEDGWVVGVAYSTSNRRPRGGGRRALYFHVVILDPKGREILDDKLERSPGSPIRIGVYEQVPYARQVLVDSGNDRVVVRGRDDHTPGDARLDFLWIYRLSTGESLTRTRLVTGRSAALDPVRDVINMGLVPGTPLLLVHWFMPGGGARFSLVSPDGTQIWALDLDEDYADIGADSRDDLNKYLADNPGILETPNTQQFSIRSFADNQRITFSVEPAADDDWAVKEISRLEYTEP